MARPNWTLLLVGGLAVSGVIAAVARWWRLHQARVELARPVVGPAPAVTPAPAPALATLPQPIPVPPPKVEKAPEVAPPAPAPQAPTIPQAAILKIVLAVVHPGMVAYRVGRQLLFGQAVEEAIAAPQVGIQAGGRLRALITIRNFGPGMGRFRVQAHLERNGQKVTDLYDLYGQARAETTMPEGSTGTLQMETLVLPWIGQPGEGRVWLDLVASVATVLDGRPVLERRYRARQAVAILEG